MPPTIETELKPNNTTLKSLHSIEGSSGYDSGVSTPSRVSSADIKADVAAFMGSPVPCGYANSKASYCSACLEEEACLTELDRVSLAKKNMTNGINIICHVYALCLSTAIVSAVVSALLCVAAAPGSLPLLGGLAATVILVSISLALGVQLNKREGVDIPRLEQRQNECYAELKLLCMMYTDEEYLGECGSVMDVGSVTSLKQPEFGR
jgi:hypothetical protein